MENYFKICLLCIIFCALTTQVLGIENGREVARKLIGNNQLIQLCSCDGKSHDNCAFCGLECFVSSTCPTCPLIYTCDKRE